MTRIIDVHGHDYPEQYLAAVMQEGSGFEHFIRDDGRVVLLRDGAVAAGIPQPRVWGQQRLALMDEAGVAVQVLSLPAAFPQANRAELMREVNDSLVREADDAPGRFRVFARLPLPDISAACAEFERVSSLSQVVGIMVESTVDCRWLDDPAFSPLWQLLSDRGAVVFVHATNACHHEDAQEYALTLAVDNLAQTTLAIARLVYSGVLVAFPGIKWLFAHLGGVLPFLIHRLDTYYEQFPSNRRHINAPPSELLKTVYFDTVSWHPPALRCAFDTFAPQQFVFGTDFPHVPGGLKLFVEALRAARLSEDELSDVEWRTAAALLGIDSPADAQSDTPREVETV